MYLTERTAITQSSLPLAGLRDHLRLGSGFGEDLLQDGLLASILRAAMAEIERQTSRSLVEREFRVALECWGSPDRQFLPRGPVTTVSEVAVNRRDGRRDILDAARYRLVSDEPRAAVQSTGGPFPHISGGEEAQITFSAGYGPSWEDVPGDLALAAVTLASARYEDRSGSEPMPEGVRALIAPYRHVRVLRSL